MTEAEFKSMIVSAIREKSRWWKPKAICLKKARTGTGKYRCASCNEIVPSYIHSTWKSGKKKGKKRKIRNILADHIDPVVDPHKGFVNWDTYIDRMFVEEGLQAICGPCHKDKTAEERKIATARRKREKTK